MKKHNSGFENTEMVFAYLASKGIPRAVMKQIKNTLAEDALCDGHDLAYNRIYSSVALILHRRLGFGQKRIMSFLDDLNILCEQVNKDEITWEEVMRELDEEVGIIVRNNEGGGQVFEYSHPDETEE